MKASTNSFDINKHLKKKKVNLPNFEDTSPS